MPVDAIHAIEAFQSATEENLICPLRRQQVVELPAEGEMWVSGDLHDHRRNLDKFVRAADLANNPQRHVVLQEIIHGDHFDGNGAEGSWQTLMRAAEWKCDFPQQVHFLLANHDLAQIYGEGIMKAGLSVCEAFTAGLKAAFGQPYHRVNVAITEFLLSSPLAVRAANGIFCCHSLPTDAQVPEFDYTVFDRELTGPDYARRTGPVYQLIWGRNFTPVGVEQFAARISAGIIITGHQPQETGFLVNGPQNLILASEHNHGVFAMIDLAEQYDMPALVRRIKRFVAVE